MLVEFATVTQILEGFLFRVSFANSPSPTRDKMKELEKEFFMASFLIHAYPCPPGTTKLCIATHAF